MADSLTWKHFFSLEPFPGKEPVGKDIHEGQCVRLRGDSYVFPFRYIAPRTLADLGEF
jgi:hypothetical protein